MTILPIARSSLGCIDFSAAQIQESLSEASDEQSVPRTF